jgi:hypothetical protein
MGDRARALETATANNALKIGPKSAIFQSRCRVADEMARTRARSAAVATQITECTT